MVARLPFGASRVRRRRAWPTSSREPERKVGRKLHRLFEHRANRFKDVPSSEATENLDQFDLGTTGFNFRTNAYPTMATDGTGRIYMAWTQRGFVADSRRRRRRAHRDRDHQGRPHLLDAAAGRRSRHAGPRPPADAVDGVCRRQADAGVLRPARQQGRARTTASRATSTPSPACARPSTSARRWRRRATSRSSSRRSGSRTT